jgi:hypothetical protein
MGMTMDHPTQPASGNGSNRPPGARPASPGPATPVYSTRLKILVVAVLAAAIGAFALAYLRSAAGDDDSIVSSGATGEFVEQLTPPSGSQVLQQATVAIDLAPGWEATLDEIGGRSIPEDDLVVRSNRQQPDTVEFTPGPDKALEALPAGRVCVRASVWQIALGPEESTRRVSWCFNVL